MEPNQNNLDPYQPQAPQPIRPDFTQPAPPPPPTPSQVEVKEPRKLKWTYVLIAFLILVILGLIGFIFMTQNKSNPTPTPTAKVTPTNTPTPEVVNPLNTSDWKSFTGNRPYTFKYPSNWDVLAENSNKAMTLVMPQEIADELRGLEINEGSSKLTLEIFEYDSPLPVETYDSDEAKEVTMENVIVNGIVANQYTTIWKQAVPGFKQGDITVSTVIPKDGKEYSIGLLKYEYLDIYKSLLSTFNFK